MDVFSQKVCDVNHKTVDEKLIDHEQRLNGHSKRLDALEVDNSSLKTEMKNLCTKVSDLISTIKWGLGIFVTVALFVLGYLIKKG